MVSMPNDVSHSESMPLALLQPRTPVPAETEVWGGQQPQVFRQRRKIGVLLSNLGTPDGTDYWSMRRYLSEFLSDRRVIETPRLLWFFILNGLILLSRPARKGKDYEKIWNRDRNESPLKTYTRSQADKLQASITRGLLGTSSVEVLVDWGMRYGNPSLHSAIDRLMAQGCDRILLVPLYPQYSAATSATACDKVFESLRTLRHQPALRVAAPYYDDPQYIEQVALSIISRCSKLARQPQVFLASFHGMPAATASKGDPYFEQCLRTGELIRRRLALPREKFIVAFQSRFGSAEWLKPYTDEAVRALAENGVRRIAVLTPGFSVDCLETIDEIGRENAEYFHAAGGEEFTRIACLNDSEGGMRVIEAIVHRELQGWR
jgi:protoporphyrin/coproporphyrin ferrochelatase